MMKIGIIELMIWIVLPVATSRAIDTTKIRVIGIEIGRRQSLGTGVAVAAVITLKHDDPITHFKI